MRRRKRKSVGHERRSRERLPNLLPLVEKQKPVDYKKHVNDSAGMAIAGRDAKTMNCRFNAESTQYFSIRNPRRHY